MSTREVRPSLAAFAAAVPEPIGEIRGATVRRGAGRARRTPARDPAGVVECDAQTWLESFVRGELTWADAVAAGRVEASGERSDLSEWLPLRGAIG